MVRAAVLGGIGVVMMQFSIRLPIFPGFLALDAADLPALVGAITTGPLTGLLAMLIRHLLDPLIFGTTTGGIGNLANFTMGVALIMPISLVVKHKPSKSGYLLGALAGVVSLIIVSTLVNYFVMLPLFSRLFFPMERIIEMGNAVNSNIHDVFTLILFAFIPFNLLRGVLVALLGYIFYRAMQPILPRLALR